MLLEAFSLETRITVLVLLAALLHACWNALVKGGRDPLLTVCIVSGVATTVCAILLPFVQAPPPAAWPYLALGVLTHNGFKIFLILSYQRGDLSRAYPLARGSAPLVVALFSGVVAGEWLSAGEWGGVLMISAGLFAIAFERGLPWGDRGNQGNQRRFLVYALLTGTFIGAYTLIDGVGVRISGRALDYSVWLFLIDGIPMFAGGLWLRRLSLRHTLNRRMIPGVLAGSLSLLAYFVVIWALRQDTVVSMAPIAALRETGVLFAAVLGRVVLKEPFGPWRLVAAGAVTAGVMVLNFSG